MESAGINRSGVANERVVRERSSQPLGPDPYAEGGNSLGVAWARGTRRPATELRNPHFRVPTLSCHGEGNIVHAAIGEAWKDAAESKNLCMRGNSRHENRENLLVSVVKRGDVTAARNGQKTSPTVHLI